MEGIGVSQAFVCSLVSGCVGFCVFMFYHHVCLPTLGYGCVKTAEIIERIDAIVLVLETRFGDVPIRIANAIREITDRETLNKMLKCAAKCGSLNEFCEELTLK